MIWETAPTAKDLKLYTNDPSMGGSNVVSDLNPSDYIAASKIGKPWKLLKQKHACYDQCVLDANKEDLLFHGGFQMNQPEIAKLFCPKLKTEENDQDYKDRVGSAAYIPTLGKLIVGLISNLYSQDLAVIEAADHSDPNTTGEEYTDSLRNYYKEFQYNCDGHGSTLHDFFRNQTTKTILHTFSYFGVDFPKGEAANLLEQEQKGLDKPILYKIHIDTVWDYKYIEGTKEFEWIKLGYCEPVQETAYDPPMHKFCIKTWYMEEDRVAWEIFKSQALPLDKEPKDKEILIREDSGITSFLSIPIICFELDKGVAVGAKLAPLAAEHFNRSTLENHATNKACLTVPVVYRGEMLPGSDSLPDPSAMVLDRGSHPRGRVNSRGVVELGEYNKDKFEIVESEGKALAFIHKQNEDIDEKMHSVVHQMGQSLKQSKSQSGRTALSKQEDRRSTEMLLTSIADGVYAVVERVFTLIAEARGEDIVFDAKGLSSIAQADRLDMVQEVLMLPKFKSPSITFTKEYYFRLMSDMVEGLDQRTLASIRGETEKTFDSEGHDEYMGVELNDLNAEQTNKASSISSPIVSSGGNPNQQPMDPPKVGNSGQIAAPEGLHLQSSQHIDSQTVYDQLAEDYKPKDIEWVLHIPWQGPMEVPLNSIDFSNKDAWQATQDPKDVKKFADKIANEGFSKPIILVNSPSNNNKMIIVDGHHRALAYMESGQPALAYVGQVGMDKGPWDKLHSKQVGSKQGSIQMSNQKGIK
jgi:hypothetical protein